MAWSRFASTGSKVLGLSPCHLLSNVSREKCIANINNLSSVNIIGGKSELRWETVLVPLCVDNYRVCLLYTLKSRYLGPNACQVTFPGGTVHKRSEFNVALCETEEELGIQPKDIRIWTKMGQVFTRNTNIVTTPVVGEILGFDREKLEPNIDVAEVFTIPMKVFCDSNNHGCCKYDNVVMPVFSGGKHMIWGQTAVITHQFLYCFLPSDSYVPSFYKREFELNELNIPITAE